MMTLPLSFLIAVGMPHLDNPTLEVILYSVVAVVLLIVGYKVGRIFGSASSTRAIAAKEQELFTAQKGFKQLYEQELATIKAENQDLKSKAEQMGVKVEEYRKK